MAVIAGAFRLGANAKMHKTENGGFASLSLAYDYYNPATKKRQTQWIDATLDGKRAERLQEYLVKGATVDASLSDFHVNTFEKKDKTTGAALAARISTISLAGSGKKDNQPAGVPVDGAE